MNKEEYELFKSLRQMVASYICEYLKDDQGHKSYEGTWELLVCYPDYFEDPSATSRPDYYRVTLHCYVLGPGRHYDWCGKTWSDALKKCRADIEKWIREEGLMADHASPSTSAPDSDAIAEYLREFEYRPEQRDSVLSKYNS